jgi:hypothetical protein
MEKTTGTPQTPHQDSDQDFEDIREDVATSVSQDDADRKARIEYLRSLTANKKPKKGRFWLKLLKILLTVIVIAALAGGVFWYFDKQGTSSKAKDDSAAQNKTNEPETPQATGTKHYDSTAFNLGFDYPQNWKVSESAGKISVASPAAKFKTASGTTDAQVIFTIQSKQSSLPGFKSGNGLALRASEKVAYVKPTPNQRGQTYMTFVSNAGSATVGLDAIFVTGDLGYQKDQAVPQVDIVQGDPLVSIFFAKCDGTTCAADPTTAKVAIADSAWSDSNALVKAAKATLTSLTIQ